jgi:hypothetical protein
MYINMGYIIYIHIYIHDGRYTRICVYKYMHLYMRFHIHTTLLILSLFLVMVVEINKSCITLLFFWFNFLQFLFDEYY